jgi:hypothetical protein
VCDVAKEFKASLGGDFVAGGGVAIKSWGGVRDVGKGDVI